MLNLTGVIHDWSQIGIIILSCALFVWAVNNPKTVYVPVLEEIGVNVKYSLDIRVPHTGEYNFVDGLQAYWFNGQYSNGMELSDYRSF